MGLLEKLKGAVLACSAKTIGVFFVTFGIYSSLIYLIKKYALYTDGMDLSDLVCGIAMIITSFPLLFSSKTVAEALCRSRVPMEMVGVNDSFGCSAHSYQELLEHYGLTAEHIVQAIESIADVK